MPVLLFLGSALDGTTPSHAFSSPRFLVGWLCGVSVAVVFFAPALVCVRVMYSSSPCPERELYSACSKQHIRSQAPAADNSLPLQSRNRSAAETNVATWLAWSCNGTTVVISGACLTHTHDDDRDDTRHICDTRTVRSSMSYTIHCVADLNRDRARALARANPQVCVRVVAHEPDTSEEPARRRHGATCARHIVLREQSYML